MGAKQYNVGVIGYGLSAKTFHIPFVQAVPDFKLYAVVQRSPKPENDAEKDFPGIKAYRSVEDMLKDSVVDVVVVTTTPDSHFELAKAALHSGKHVIIEKPFTPSQVEAEKLIALAKEKNRLLSVYHNRRWDADFVTVANLVKDGTLGRVVEFESHFDRHRPEMPAAGSWKTQVMPGGGAIYDLGVHVIDQAVYLFGLPKKITGFVGSQRENNTSGFEDSFTVLLHYDDGKTVTLKAAVISPEEKQLRFWVRGDKGSYKKYHLDIQEEHLRSGLRQGDSGYAKEPPERYGTLTTMKDGKFTTTLYPTVDPPTWIAYYRQFAQALNGEGDVPVTADDAQAVIRLVELAKASSALGKTMDVN